MPSEAAGLEGRPEAENLLGIYAALSDRSRDEALAAVGGKPFSDFKKEPTDLAVARIGPMTEEMQRLRSVAYHIDRTCVVSGQRVTVSVNFGWRRNTKKKNTH